jgi:3-oxoacyl-[acyl-carrier protein] reductase
MRSGLSQTHDITWCEYHKDFGISGLADTGGNRSTAPCGRMAFLYARMGSAARVFRRFERPIQGPRQFQMKGFSFDNQEADMQNYMDMTGKVALVTGASSGIGAATAAVLADLGAQVAIGYHQNEQGGTEVRQAILSAGGKAIAIQADVRQSAGIRRMVDQVTRELGPIDILINNAGSLVKRTPLLEVTEDSWDNVMNLNLKSAVLCSQAVVPSMIERKSGAIVNIVSIAGRNGGGPGAGPYSSAKGGLITFTKSLAREMAPHGVRVNAVSPGVIDTPFHEAFSTPAMLANFVKGIPLGRVGTSMECATVIAFLASDASGFVIGETVEVNGGQLML